MDIIPRIFERLGWRLSKTEPAVPIARPNALGSSPFRELPLELICHIASSLPLESVGSLSLSCLHLYSCLKMKYLQPLKEAEYSVMNRFLCLLERDLPAYIVCPECNKLHYMPFAERHLASELYSSPSGDSLKCRIADSKGHYVGGIPGGFSSTIFRMAMKSHRQGKDTTTLLRLLSYRNMDKYQIGFVELHTAEARICDGSICDGSLFVREQKVFMIPPSEKTPLPWSGGFGICRHIALTEMSDLYWWGIRVPQADEIDGYENKQGIIYCQHCHTEFRVDFKSYGEAGNALFITQWMDLGQGRDANDFKRRIRLNGSERRKKVTYQRGSICAAFEQNTEFKFDSLLTEKDKKELRMLSHWSWPINVTVLGKEVKIGYVVRNGRLVPKF
ncbi:hypothetical protein VC83_08376 [Pseudogymnoascus destructans]|uniref:F-box domain-containing protein n=1 Tax=Pseudogymnoascus destructans TaxID=655981 RepID=A0A176ZZL7_9PEZI|nr:uncharacterized protein VC83_08376 [Pseudogymnoascus destructans]OAF55485.2 hypothetical protein VC83_08376 [Pseudogymnoascus destructans]